MNISRGGIVVESALKKALDEGRIGFAALDVRSPEPPDPSIRAVAWLTARVQMDQ